MDLTERILACEDADSIDAELAAADGATADAVGRALEAAARQALERRKWGVLEYVASHLKQIARETVHGGAAHGGAARGGAAHGGAAYGSAERGSLAAAVWGGGDPQLDAQLQALGATYPCVVQKCPACRLVDIGDVQFVVPAKGEADRAFRLALGPYLAPHAAAANRARVTRVVDSGRTAQHRGARVKVYSFLLEPQLGTEQPR